MRGTRRNKELLPTSTGTPQEDVLPSLDSILHNEQDKLVNSSYIWGRRTLIYFPMAATIAGWLGGQPADQYLNPLFMSLAGLSAEYLNNNLHPLLKIVGAHTIISIPIVRHVLLYQGCSACMVPAIYGFFPCVTGFLFRTTQAITISTIYVLCIIAIVFSVDLTGNCPSDPIDPSSRGTIIADRLAPLLMLIVGNSVLINLIVKHNQSSLVLHAKAAEEASQLAVLRRDVLHRVTHELRTPLNGLVGSVELLTASETLTREDMEDVLTMQRCLSAILGICDDVLTVAKHNQTKEKRSVPKKKQSADLEEIANKSKNPTNPVVSVQSSLHSSSRQHREPFRIASVVDDVAEIFGATLSSKGVQLHVQFIGDTTTQAYGSEVKLRQILLNLVGNANKFTEHGSITIRTTVNRHDVDCDMLQCSFDVIDTGVGIDSSTSEFLFEPFHQGEHRAVSRKHKGTGLGLSICREFVEEMGGTIIAEGEEGIGSIFHFTLILPEYKHDILKVLPFSSTPEQVQVLVADSCFDSRISCESVIESSVRACGYGKPKFITLDSHKKLLHYLEKVEKSNCFSETGVDGNKSCKRIAFVEVQSVQDLSVVVRLRKLGWNVIVQCQRVKFPELATESAFGLAAAVFRKPLPLVRAFDAMHNILGKSTVITSKSISKEVPNLQSVPKLELDARNCMEQGKPESESKAALKTGIVLAENTKIVVVDDTKVNVKVVTKMLSRIILKSNILSFYDGQSAVEMVLSAKPTDVLLFLMDWHMPGVCGLEASNSIRKIVAERGGPSIQICMLTADVEGLNVELNRRSMSYKGVVSSTGVLSICHTDDEDNNEATADSLDIIAGKPVTFKSLQAIFEGFQR